MTQSIERKPVWVVDGVVVGDQIDDTTSAGADGSPPDLYWSQGGELAGRVLASDTAGPADPLVLSASDRRLLFEAADKYDRLSRTGSRSELAGVYLGSRDCGLCVEHCHTFNATGEQCGNCPVRRHTGSPSCYDTPYYLRISVRFVGDFVVNVRAAWGSLGTLIGALREGSRLSETSVPYSALLALFKERCKQEADFLRTLAETSIRE